MAQPRYFDAPILVEVEEGPITKGHYMDCKCGALMRFLRADDVDFCSDCGQHFLIVIVKGKNNDGKL